MLTNYVKNNVDEKPRPMTSPYDVNLNDREDLIMSVRQ